MAISSRVLGETPAPKIGASRAIASNLREHFRTALGRVRSQWVQKGPRGTFRAIGRTIIDPLLRYRRHLVWEVFSDAQRRPSEWSSEEKFLIIGPDDLDKEMNPRLLEFLGGKRAADDLKGVSEGDRLLAVRVGDKYIYSAYIYFDTTQETRRQKKVIAETQDTPIIGTCYRLKSEILAGKPVHRRVLNDAFRYLGELGYSRVVLEVLADNRPSNDANAAVGMTICRELRDWTIVKRLVLQRVIEPHRSYLRLFLI